MAERENDSVKSEVLETIWKEVERFQGFLLSKGETNVKDASLYWLYRRARMLVDDISHLVFTENEKVISLAVCAASVIAELYKEQR